MGDGSTKIVPPRAEWSFEKASRLAPFLFLLFSFIPSNYESVGWGTHNQDGVFSPCQFAVTCGSSGNPQSYTMWCDLSFHTFLNPVKLTHQDLLSALSVL